MDETVLAILGWHVSYQKRRVNVCLFLQISFDSTGRRMDMISDDLCISVL
jgi:hypothetical protein